MTTATVTWADSRRWGIALATIAIAAATGLLAPRAFALQSQSVAVVAGVLGLCAVTLVSSRWFDLIVGSATVFAFCALTQILHSSQAVAGTKHPFYETSFAQVTLPEMCLALAVGLAILHGAPVLRQLVTAQFSVFWLLAAIVIVGGVTGLLRTGEFEPVIRDGRKLAVGVGGFLLVMAVARSLRRERALWIAASLGAVVAAISQLVLWSQGSAWLYRGALRTTVDVADFLVLLGALCVPLALIRSRALSARQTTCAWLVMGLAALALIATGSRAAWFAAPVGLAVVLFAPAGSKRVSARWVAPMLALAVVVVPLAVTASQETLEQRLETLKDQLSDSSDRYRLRELQGTSAVIADHPFVGVGFGAPFSAGSSLLDRRDSSRGMVHHLGLWVGAKSGLIGLVALIAAFTITVRRLWRVMSRAEAGRDRGLALGLLAMLAMFVVVGQVGAMLNQIRTAFLLGVMFALATQLARRVDQARPTAVEEAPA